MADDVVPADGRRRLWVGLLYVEAVKHKYEGLPLRRFPVFGAEVWTRCVPDEVPLPASLVGLTGLVIDRSDGPMACVAARESRPPRGSGPVVDGLELGGSWTETHREVTWGHRSMVFTWPPHDGRVELVEDGPVRNEQASPRIAGPHGFRASDGHCYSEAKLREVRQQLAAVPYAETYMYSVQSHLPSNRAIVRVVVSDGWAVSRLATSIEDPRMLIVTGSAAILGS